MEKKLLPILIYGTTRADRQACRKLMQSGIEHELVETGGGNTPRVLLGNRTYCCVKQIGKFIDDVPRVRVAFDFSDPQSWEVVRQLEEFCLRVVTTPVEDLAEPEMCVGQKRFRGFAEIREFLQTAPTKEE